MRLQTFLDVASNGVDGEHDSSDAVLLLVHFNSTAFTYGTLYVA